MFRGHEIEEAGPATRSARDGTFKLRLEKGAFVWLRVRANGYPERVLPVRAAGERTDVVLDDGVTLDVTVRDESGAAVPEVAIHVTRRHVGDEVFARRAVTDADGRARVTGLPPGLEAYVGAHPDSRGRLPMTRISLPRSGRLGVELIARDVGNVAGRVVSAADGSPIAGAQVGWDLLLNGAVIAGEDGQFVLPGWHGEFDDAVHAEAPGFVQRATSAGAGNDLLIQMATADAVTGRVIDAAGSPVEGARVAVYGIQARREDPEASQGRCVSNSEGRFRVDGVSARTPNALIVEARGHARIYRKLAVAETDLGDLRMGVTRRVEGRMLVDGATPVARAEISLVPSERFHQGSPWFDGRMIRYSDDLGRYQFRDVAPGSYLLAVMCDGYPRIGHTIEVPADTDLLDANLELPALRPLTVRATTADGNPVAGVWIMARVVGFSPTNGRTDSDGRSVVHVPLDQEVTLQAFPRRADAKAFVPPPQQRIAPGVNHAEFELGAASPVTGRVVDESGEAIARALIDIAQSGQPTKSVAADGDGRFVAATTPEGLVTLRFTGMVRERRGDRDTGLRAELTGVAPGTADVVLRADRTSAPAEDLTFHIRVDDPDGNPVEGATVVIFAEGRPGMRSVTTGPDGTAVLADAPDVTHALQAPIHGEWYASRAATARPADGEVVLAYRAAVHIEGEAVDSSGARVTGGEARAVRGGLLVYGNPVGDDGSFRLIVPEDENDGITVEVRVTEGTKTHRGETVWDGQDRVRVVVRDE